LGWTQATVPPGLGLDLNLQLAGLGLVSCWTWTLLAKWWTSAALSNIRRRDQVPIGCRLAAWALDMCKTDFAKSIA